MVIPHYLLNAREFLHIVDCVICAHLLCSILCGLVAWYLKWIHWVQWDLPQSCFVLSTILMWALLHWKLLFGHHQNFLHLPMWILSCNFCLQIYSNLIVFCNLILVKFLPYLLVIACVGWMLLVQMLLQLDLMAFWTLLLVVHLCR